jgi:hypothetical protein
MFRRISILLLFISFRVFLIAQESFEPTTHVGIHGGINFSSVNFNPTIKEEFLPSQAFGIYLRHVSEPHIGIQIELNAAGKGWKEVIDSVGTYTRKIQTFNLPLMAAFIAGSRVLRFAFTLGPYVDYRRQDKEVIDIPDQSYYRPHYLVPLADKWEFGFIGGVAVELHTKIGGFAIRASYSHALTNLYPLNKGTFYFSGSRMMVIHGGIGYFVSF